MKRSAAEESAPDCAGRRFAIVAAGFYRDLADDLIEGATQGLRACKVAERDITVCRVSGCFELPLGCRTLIESDRFDALVALGVVIRGATLHFDLIARECARGLMNVQLATGTPIGFGVLTTEDRAQAEERADTRRGNKGYEAALAAASMVRMSAALPRAGFRSAPR